MSIEQPIQEPSPMDAFRQELEEFRSAEQEEGTAKHLSMSKDREPVDFNLLTEEDMDIWERCKAGELTRNDIEMYKDSILEEEVDRKEFAAFVVHKWMEQMYKEGKL